MTQHEEQAAHPTWWQRISEDWWSVIIGSSLIVLVLLGLLAGIPW